MQPSFHLNLRRALDRGTKEKKSVVEKGCRASTLALLTLWSEEFLLWGTVLRAVGYKAAPLVSMVYASSIISLPAVTSKNVSRLCQMFLGMEENGDRKPGWELPFWSMWKQGIGVYPGHPQFPFSLTNILLL